MKKKEWVNPTSINEDFEKAGIDISSANQLTEQEIKEGTEILALFEGSSFCNDDTEAYPNGYFMFEDTGAIESKDMVYHTSYGWLMPVWVKFRDMRLYIDSSVYYFHLFECEKSICNQSISEAFRALVSAVKWFNSIEKK